MNICEHLSETAAIVPKQTALVFDERRWTYGDLDQAVRLASGYLSDVGVQHGERVAIALPNTPAFVVWYYAIVRLGGIAVSVSTRLTTDEICFIVDDCEATALIVLESNTPQLGTHKPACLRQIVTVNTAADQVDGRNLSDFAAAHTSAHATLPQDPAVILYTSGTTGFPKGATLSHENVRVTVHAFNHLCRLSKTDRLLCSVPLFHCYGQNALLNAGFHAGATIVLQQRFDLNESKLLIKTERVTKLFGVPTMFQLLGESCNPADLASVDYCFSAATTLPPVVAQRWQEKFGMPIHEGYGLTETAPFASYNHRLEFVPGSIGAPVDLVEMKVVNTETGQTCLPGELGEIVVRGPNVMLGYWNRPEETAEAIRDGWFYSGDIGRVDERGYFFIVDRVKDMISIGGLKVFPAEVERVVHEHSEIADVAVVGVADPVFGEKVIAFVVPAAGDFDFQDSVASAELAESIRQFSQRQVASYKMPKRFFLIQELPRNPAGKVLKRVLREQAEKATSSAGLDGGTVAESGAEGVEPNAAQAVIDSDQLLPIEPELTEWVSEMLQVHPAHRLRTITAMLQAEVREMLQIDHDPAPEDRFLEAGLDSLLIVDLQERLKERLGSASELPATLVFDYPSIGDLAGFLLLEVERSSTTVASDRAETVDIGRAERTAAEVEARKTSQVRRNVTNPRFSPIDSDSSATPESNIRKNTGQFAAEIAGLSEQEALDELIRELDND